MGQSIVVTEKPSSHVGVVRFETNRALTGMGHERYLSGAEIWGERPPDELARRLLAKRSVAGVQINANVVTVDLAKGHDAAGLREIIENLYRFYPDQPDGAGTAPAEPAAESDSPIADDEAAAAPESLAEPADATTETFGDAPDPEVDEERPTAANPASAGSADAVPPPPPSPVPAPPAETPPADAVSPPPPPPVPVPPAETADEQP